MKVRDELIEKYRLISWMKNFDGTKNLKNILRRLKSNVDIFRYLFIYLTLNFFSRMGRDFVLKYKTSALNFSNGSV